MSPREDGGCAFPRPGANVRADNGQMLYDLGSAGMSLRQYAAIKLRVPDSGAPWLDQMIQQSLHDEFAAKAMHAELVTNGVPGEACDAMLLAAHKADRTPEAQIAWNAYQMADAMLAAREKGGAA